MASSIARAVPAFALAVFAVGCQNAAAPPSPTPTPAVTASALNITGVVRDTLVRPVSGVRVEVVEASAAGLVAITNEEGRFTLSASALVPQLVTTHVSKDGYTSNTLRLRNNVPDAVISLVAADLVDLQGQYSITFTAASSCDQLPAAVRSRTFTGTIRPTTPNRWLFTSELSAANFHPGYGTFFGAVSDAAARFYVSSWDAFNWWLEEQPIIERLDSNAYVSLMGTATSSTVTSNRSIAATFDGTIEYCAAAGEPTAPNYPLTCAAPADCTSRNHQMTLTRRD